MFCLKSNGVYHAMITPECFTTAKAEQPPEAESLASGVDSVSTKDNKVDITTTPTPDAPSSSLKKTVNLTCESFIQDVLNLCQ